MAKKVRTGVVAAPTLESPLDKKARVDAEIKRFEARVWKAITGANIAFSVLVLSNVIYRLTKQEGADARFAAMTKHVLNKTIAAIGGEEAPLPGEEKPSTSLIVADALYNRRRN